MVPILLPNLSTLPKLITQMPQKELQILIRLRERILERRIYIIYSGFLWRSADFLGEKVEVFAVVLQVRLGVKCPACFEMTGDDFLRFEGLD
jgi:hypothetical protein